MVKNTTKMSYYVYIHNIFESYCTYQKLPLTAAVISFFSQLKESLN